RPLDERAGERHALLLTARELRDPAPFHAGKTNKRERLLYPPSPLCPRHPLQRQAVGDIALDAHVREERVALEDGVGGPLIWLAAGDVDALDLHLSGRRFDKTPDDAQRRRLPTAAR